MRAHFVAIALTLLIGCSSGSDDPPPNLPPTARFDPTATSGVAPLTVFFDGTASSDSDGEIINYGWDFDDGSPTAFGATVEHTFQLPGTYAVALTVRDDDQATTQTTRSIEVAQPLGTLSVSGTIQILSSSVIDTDVNDQASPPTSNDTADDAQFIPNPATVGGFINMPNTGAPSGNLFATGDPADFYLVNLTGDENILLTIGDSPTIVDIDLELYDENDLENPAEASLGVGGSESIAAPGPGNYFIKVVPFMGASNYVLSVGQNVEVVASGSRLSSDFVPHRAIAQMAAAPPAPKAISGARIESNQYIELARSGNLSLVETTPGPNIQAARFADPLRQAKYETLLAIKRLARDPAFECVEPNLIRRAHALPNDQFFDLQWHYDNINLPLAWDITLGDPNVLVAVIDTGVLLDHPDLQGQLVAGYDFISDPGIANDGNGRDSDPADPGDQSQPGASSFHGTHVAGTIAAASDNGIGVAGVAQRALIMPLRALGVGGGTSFDIIAAAQYAAGITNSSGQLPLQPADIINLSLGGGGFSQMEQNVYTEIRNRGVIVVASAGNSSTSAPSYPAAYDGVISVSATTITNALAPYSNFGGALGGRIDIAAPGGFNGTDLNGDGLGDGVISTLGSDSSPGQIVFGYAALNGTSMAAPHVAGVAALMKAMHPELTALQFQTALAAGAITDDIGPPGRDNSFGNGLINARKAVLEAVRMADGTSNDPGPVVAATPSALNLGAFDTAASLVVENIGSGQPQMIQVTRSAPWLSIDPSVFEIDPFGFGPYSIGVKRQGLADGTYSGQIVFDTDANDVVVRVIMQVSSIDQSANAGLHFVILVDPATSLAVEQLQVQPTDGEYRFQFNQVRDGNYRVFAGTDSDDDGFICDSGEACGAFRTLDSPDTLTLTEDVTDADFISGFRFNLADPSANAAPGAPADEGGARGYRIDKPN